jgi:hypothetical protein
MKTKILLSVFVLLSLFSCKKEPGKLSGVVTYYFNKAQGDKPDVGSNVFIVKADEIDSNSVEHLRSINMVTGSYQTMKESRIALKDDSLSLAQNEFPQMAETYKMSIDMNKGIVETYSKLLDDYKIKTDEDFDKYDSQASDELKNFKSNKNISTFVVDGNGSFSTMLPPDKYWVLIESNNRNRDNSKTELLHQVSLQLVEVNTEKEKTVNEKFGL